MADPESSTGLHWIGKTEFGVLLSTACFCPPPKQSIAGTSLKGSVQGQPLPLTALFAPSWVHFPPHFLCMSKHGPPPTSPPSPVRPRAWSIQLGATVSAPSVLGQRQSCREGRHPGMAAPSHHTVGFGLLCYIEILYL